MKKIVNKTYRNFLIVVKKIQQKGYPKDEAERITNQIFDNFNPCGKSIETMINDILPHEEYVKLYGDDI